MARNLDQPFPSFSVTYGISKQTNKQERKEKSTVLLKL